MGVRSIVQVGMDGPNVNLKFEQHLAAKIMEECGASFLNIGSCSLHQTHNAFRKGILDFDFNIESFVNDIIFFFNCLQLVGKTTNLCKYSLKLKQNMLFSMLVVDGCP